jgi:Fe2+ or Zn2+ uptake regulation protein
MFTTLSLCERLHREGKKVTPQRRLIYQALESKHSHPRAEDIYEDVRAIIPDISLGTVYKTLRELVEMGEIMEIKYYGEQSRFDIITSPHNHLICIKCQKIEDVLRQVPIPEPDSIEKNGFRIRQSEILYWGYCSGCQS